MRLALAATGPADPALAWERYADPSLWPTWSPQIRSVSTTARLAPGTTGTVHGWGGLELPFTVESVDEAVRTWVWTVRPDRALVRLPEAVSRWGAMRLEHAVVPAAAGSRTTLLVEGAAPVVLAYAPLAWLALRRLVR